MLHACAHRLFPGTPLCCLERRFVCPFANLRRLQHYETVGHTVWGAYWQFRVSERLHQTGSREGISG